MKNHKSTSFLTFVKLDTQNLKASWHKNREESCLIEDLLYLYQNFSRNLKTYPREQIPVISMFWSCLSGYVISTRLCLETHIPEAYALISRSAEAVGYARKMSKESKKTLIWINKDKANIKEFRTKFGQPFPSDDKLLYPEIYDIYNLTTNYGRHQNLESTIFSSNLNILNKNKIIFNYSYIDDEINLHRCINYTIYAYYKFLFCFKEIFFNYLFANWINYFVNYEERFNKHRDNLKTTL